MAIINGEPWRLQYGTNPTQTGDITGWDTSTVLPFAVGGNSVVITDRKVLTIGGFVSGTASDTVYYAPINADGTLGTWANTGVSLPTPLADFQAVLTKDRLCLLGGADDVDFATTTVLTAALNDQGLVDSWSAGTYSLSGARAKHSAIVTDDLLYLIGGEDASGTRLSSTVYATIAADGTLGDWASGTSLPAAVKDAAAVKIGDRVFLLGGNNSTDDSVNTIYVATIGVGGVLGSWSTYSGTLPYPLSGHGSAVVDDTIYIFGGYNNTDNIATVSYAAIDVSGDIGTWSTGTALPAATEAARICITSSKIFAIGGYDVVDTVANYVSVAPFAGGENNYTTLSGITWQVAMTEPLPIMRSDWGWDIAMVEPMPRMESTISIPVFWSVAMTEPLPKMSSTFQPGLAWMVAMIEPLPRMRSTFAETQKWDVAMVEPLPIMESDFYPSLSWDVAMGEPLPIMRSQITIPVSSETVIQFSRPCSGQ